MEKLELKHVKGYLGTNLKGLIFYPHSDDETCTLKIKNGFNNECDINDFINGTYQIKPILHPLSDLTKEELNNLKNLYFDKDIVTNSISDLCFWWGNTTNLEEIKDVFEYLYSKHYDIHGLIEKGLAIDINTLDNGIQ